MKKLWLTIIPALAALLMTMSLATLRVANADSFPFSPSPIQSQQQQPHQVQQYTTLSTNSGGLQLTDHLLPLSSLIPSQSSQQQQQNETAQQQQPLIANGLVSHNNNKVDNHSPSVISELPF